MSAAPVTATPEPKRAKKVAAVEAPKTFPAVKGFNRDLTCRDFQFEIGATFEIGGKIEACRNGFHACPETVDPLKVFGFYAPGVSRYCDVVQGGEVVPHDDDKAASSRITIVREIGIGEIVDRAVAFRLANAKATGETTISATRGAASNSGTRGAASNSGTRGAASNSGYSGAASNSGDYGAAFSHSYAGKVMSEKDDCFLAASELDSNYKLVSGACGITGRDGIEAGVWYVCRAGKLVAV